MHTVAPATAPSRVHPSRAQQILLRVGLGVLLLLALMVLSVLNSSQARADDAPDDLGGGLLSSVLDLPSGVLDTVGDAVVQPVVTPVVERVVRPVVTQVVAPVVQQVVQPVLSPVADAVVPAEPVKPVVALNLEPADAVTPAIGAATTPTVIEPKTAAPDATATTPDEVRSPDPAPAAPGTPAASSAVGSGASGGATGAADTFGFWVGGAAASAALLFASGTSPPASPTFDHDTSPD